MLNTTLVSSTFSEITDLHTTLCFRLPIFSVAEADAEAVGTAAGGGAGVNGGDDGAGAKRKAYPIDGVV